MKKSIIREIFYGTKGNSETIRESEEYRELLSESIELGEMLRKTLSKEQKAIFDRFDSTDTDLEEKAGLTYFVEGFKIGLLIGIECMDE